MGGDAWQLEILGGAILTSPTGDETYFPVREVWTVRGGRTIRFMLFRDGEPRPIFCIHGPCERGHLARMAADAFVEFIANEQ